jgi:hypothetical protein
MGVIKWLAQMVMLWRRTFKPQPDIFEERYGKALKRWSQYRDKKTGRYISVKLWYWCFVCGYNTKSRTTHNRFEAWAEFVRNKKQREEKDVLSAIQVKDFVDETIGKTPYWGIVNMGKIRAYWAEENEPVFKDDETGKSDIEVPPPGKIRVRVWRVEDDEYGEKIIDEYEKYP